MRSVTWRIQSVILIFRTGVSCHVAKRYADRSGTWRGRWGQALQFRGLPRGKQMKIVSNKMILTWRPRYDNQDMI